MKASIEAIAGLVQARKSVMLPPDFALPFVTCSHVDPFPPIWEQGNGREDMPMDGLDIIVPLRYNDKLGLTMALCPVCKTLYFKGE